MRAIKIQTKAGRKMSETGIIPAFFHIGNFWTFTHEPLFERISIDADGLDNLPDGTISHGTSSLGLSARLSASNLHESRSMRFLIDAMR